VSDAVEHGVSEVMSQDGTALRDRVEAALDEVRPGIRADGGDVWLVKVEAGVAYVQMVGACGGCAMVNATLKLAIEQRVTAVCPEISRVEQI
jgi:Fe-S cluster biogenesis protein NfuA